MVTFNSVETVFIYGVFMYEVVLGQSRYIQVQNRHLYVASIGTEISTEKSRYSFYYGRNSKIIGLFLSYPWKNYYIENSELKLIAPFSTYLFRTTFQQYLSKFALLLYF